MATSGKKIAANRLNALKSTGPTNTSSTRFNAAKHGLRAIGITELDDPEAYHKLLRDFMEEKTPIGPIENALVKAIALDLVRLDRARRLEAEYLTAVLNPPILGGGFGFDHFTIGEPSVVDPGIPASIEFESAQRLAIFQRYESVYAARLFRAMHELERLQRMREGEKLSAPAIVDVNLDVESKMDNASNQVLEQSTAEPNEESEAAEVETNGPK